MPSKTSTKEQAGDAGYKLHVHQWIKSNPSVTHNPDLPSEPGESGLATKLYNACLKILQSFYRLSLSQKPLQTHAAILKEELAKLFLWGESFRSGELDEVLAFAEGLRQVVFEKFIEIGQLLLGLMKLPDFSEAKKVRSCRGLTALLEEAKLVVVQRGNEDNREESDSSSDYNSDDESRTATQDFGQIAKWLQTQTSQLARIGPALRRSLARLEKEKFESKSAYPPVVPFQVSSAAGAYVSLLRDRFKDASPDLLERLGEANWQRHQNIRNAAISSDAKIETASAAVFRPASTFYDSGLGTSVPVRTSYAQSHTSFLSSNTNGELGDLRVPSMPREAQSGKPFDCFLCKETLTCVRSRVDWKIHVFADLRPYICTFPGCKEELAQFSSRVEWGEHEFKCHRFVSTWRCPNCPETYSKLIDYEDHLISKHGRQQDSVTWKVSLDLALDKQENPAELEQCPLCCATPGSSRRNFVNHVARHMEQIALTALPRDVEESDDEVDKITSESSADHVPGADDRFSTTNDPFPPGVSSADPPLLNDEFSPTSQVARPSSTMASKETSIPPSSTKWTPDKDELLLQARRQGLDWVSVATKHFPDKSANACRKRFERLKAKDDALEASGVPKATDASKATAAPDNYDGLFNNDLNDPNILENFDFEQFLQNDAFNFDSRDYQDPEVAQGEGRGESQKSSSEHRHMKAKDDTLEASGTPKATDASKATDAPDDHDDLSGPGPTDSKSLENPDSDQASQDFDLGMGPNPYQKMSLSEYFARKKRIERDERVPTPEKE